ncbi:hypothetical protein FOA43_002031 [Brettanomyces nanus]|uniref:BZIP domain-containing protein n=1 Tax=Eeniella nana TaxID=13502 RepID=A0A875S161_EENNA|nr:uncharacterized protein FOA43_002031 [Brettanomyces nanus]QPG74698.1 hypothetical protein FOA43_002031 [Brettanomyces nanus]
MDHRQYFPMFSPESIGSSLLSTFDQQPQTPQPQTSLSTDLQSSKDLQSSTLQSSTQLTAQTTFEDPSFSTSMGSEGEFSPVSADSSTGGTSGTSGASGASGPEAALDRRKLTDNQLYQRRKAQNRAAQRAFRERKEGKLRELSAKLDMAESEKRELQKQLQDLKQKNSMLDMENKLLHKDSTSPPQHLSPSNGSFAFPQFTREKFIEGSVDMNKHIWNDDMLGSKRYDVDHTSLLTASAVWDYLVEFGKMNEEIEVDIPGIMNDLKGKEVCHGYGPAYSLGLVTATLKKHIIK